MNWYYKVMGGHTHVRVFMNGAKCGDLCFRNEEFIALRETYELIQKAVDYKVYQVSKQPAPFITFFNE